MVASRLPAPSTAKKRGTSPESLCAQSTPGCAMLATTPEISFSAGSESAPVASGAAHAGHAEAPPPPAVPPWPALLDDADVLVPVLCLPPPEQARIEARTGRTARRSVRMSDHYTIGSAIRQRGRELRRMVSSVARSL